MIGPWLLTWCFYLPFLGALAAVPFSSSVGRFIALAVAVVNFIVPALFYLGPDAIWIEMLRGLALGGGPVPLQLDSLTVPFLLLIKGASLYSIVEKPSRLGRTYLCCLFGADFALSASLLSGDCFGTLFFAELSLIPLCLLIATWGGHDRLYASRKFFLCQTAACGLWLIAISLQAAAHESQFGFFSGLPADLGKVASQAERFAFFCFLAGCFLRSAVFPLHSWLPEVLAQGPLSVSLFVIVGVLPSGMLALVKMGLPVFPEGFDALRSPMESLAVVGAIYGALLAWRQNDGYRYLAYGGSFLSALVFASLLQASPIPWTAGAFHLLAGSLSLFGLVILFNFCSEIRQSRQFADWAGMGQQFPEGRSVLLFFLASLIFVPGSGAFPGAFALLAESLDRNLMWCVGILAALFLAAAGTMRVGGTLAFGSYTPSTAQQRSAIGPRLRLTLLTIGLVLLTMGIAPRLTMVSLQRPIDAFWESLPAKDRFFVLPRDAPHQSLKREFQRERHH